MKSGPLLTIVLFTTLSLNAQKTDKPLTAVQYNCKHVIDTTQREYPTTRPFMLILGSKLSRYDDYYAIMWDQGTPVKETLTDASGKVFTSMIASGGVSDQYIKNIPENKMTTITLLGESYYAIDGDLPKINWKIYNEQKIIKDYKCQKATTTFKGRNYTAWFAVEIPYSNGPWKLGGLPGLILEASDDSKEVIFECTAIIDAQNYKPIEISNEFIRVDPDKFKKIQTAIKKDAAALSGAASVRPSSIVATGVRNSQGSGRPPRVFNNPIEKP